MQFATRQRGFQHIARIHRAVGFASAHQSVDFVDEDDGLAIVFGQIVQYRFQTLFKFTAEFCARNQAGQIQYQQAFAF